MSKGLYRCGVIEESLISTVPLAKLKPYLVRSRVDSVPNEDPPEWHTNEYLIPHDDLVGLLPELELELKPDWYIHAFNIEENVLIVVLHGKSFRLPTTRDSSWDQMIQYGKDVGCEPRWTENIPLRV